MHVLRMTIRLALKQCGGPKDRDNRLAAMSARLREHFNIAVIHGGVPGSNAEGWLSMVTVALNPKAALETLERVAEALAVHPDCHLLTPPEVKTL